MRTLVDRTRKKMLPWVDPLLEQLFPDLELAAVASEALHERLGEALQQPTLPSLLPSHGGRRDVPSRL